MYQTSCTPAWKYSRNLRFISAAVLLSEMISTARLYVDAVLDHIVLDQLVRKTIVFCEQKRLEMAGIEAEHFQELLVHEFRRPCAKLPLKWPVYAMGGMALRLAVG